MDPKCIRSSSIKFGVECVGMDEVDERIVPGKGEEGLLKINHQT